MFWVCQKRHAILPLRPARLNAFRNCNSGNAVKASGATAPESHALARGMFASTTWQDTRKLLSA